MNNLPKKVYVELTTRCNLRCQMCVKYMPGSCITEMDMDVAIFRQLLPVLTHTKSLILNGIGESLLHPDLVEIIALARQRMGKEGLIGLQSNGLLVDKPLALAMIQAGLSSICLSVEGFDASVSSHKSGAGEHSFSSVASAISNLAWAKKRTGGVCKIGIEVVLSKGSVDQLPALVSWAAANEVDYILTTHLILYDKATESENLFNPNSREAVQLYNKYQQLATAKGIDLVTGFAEYRKYAGTRSDSDVLYLFREMLSEAREKDIRLNLDNLHTQNDTLMEDVTRSIDMAHDIAKSHGVELFTPPLQATSQRNCPFVEEETAFIAPNGDVMPCHFLWHSYVCRVLNEDIQVQKRIFGNITEQPFEQIWRRKEYMRFRREAGQYDYAPCWSCSQGPCAALVNDDSHYANDCYGSIVPCGHCQWNLGGIRCL